MFRNTLALAAAAAVAGLAHADDVVTVTAELTYEPALLATEEGALETLSSFERQARRHCRTLSMTSAGFSYDEVCIASLVESAVSEIGSETLAQTFVALETDKFGS
ncbi:MAG: UrcA family protein [Pseudomonadota bacterium]